MDRHHRNAIAFFYLSKCYFPKGHIYGGKISTITKEMGLSYRSVKKYTQTLLSLDFMYWHHGNLCFRSARRVREFFEDDKQRREWEKGNSLSKNLPRRHLCTVKIRKEMSIREVKIVLFAKIVEQSLRQQNWMIAKKSAERLNSVPLTGAKLARVSTAITFSNAKLAKQLYICQKTLVKYKRYWKSNGFFNIRTERPMLMAQMSLNEFNRRRSEFDGRVFWCRTSRGHEIVCRAFPSHYDSLIYPVHTQ